MTEAAPRRRLGVWSGLLLATVVTLTAGAALADDPNANARPWLAQAPGAAPAPAAAPEPAARLSWRASVLVLVSAGLGGAAVWVRGRKSKMGMLTSSRDLRVISTVRVGPKGHLVLAGVGDRAILLGVTDDSVRRIAWLPADQLNTVAATEAPADGTTNPAASPAAARGNVALRGAKTNDEGHLVAAHKGGFAEILRKLGNRPVDAPPDDDNAATAALAIADMRGDDVEWSRGASSARAGQRTPANGSASPTARAHESSPPRSPKRHESGPAEMEQQAAGILKRRSRSRS